jgi:hypothetical protein
LDLIGLASLDDSAFEGVSTMKDFESGFPPKRAPSRRSYLRTIIFAVCAAFVLTVFVCCYAVTMVAMAVLKGIAEGIAHLGNFFSVFVFAALVMVPWLLELLSLLSTGQLIPFVMRLFQMLGSS